MFFLIGDTMSEKRLSFEIDETLRDKFNKKIPWGLRRPLLSAFVEQVINVMENEEKAEAMIAAIMQHKLNVADIMVENYKNGSS